MMWVLRIKTRAENSFVTKIALDSGVSFSGYPMDWYPEGSGIILRVHGVVLGSLDDSKNLMSYISKVPQVKRFYANNNFIFALIKQPRWMGTLYSKDLIFTKPQLYTYDGFEHTEVASFTKEPLTKFLKIMKEHYSVDLLSFKKEDISSISTISLQPQLTEKQNAALGLAIKKGYYDWPRKITLKELAKEFGVSYSTFQAHLAKAEKYFIPNMYGGIYRQ